MECDFSLVQITAKEADTLTQESVVKQVLAERKRQDQLFGSQWHRTRAEWLSILMEEVGEAAQASNDGDTKHFAEEMVQVAALAIAILEGHNRGRA